MSMGQFDTETIDSTTKKDKEEIKKPAYISKDGFVEGKIRRGLYEIQSLLDLLKQHSLNNTIICGGYIRYMCSPHSKPVRAGDADLYSYTKEEYKILIKVFADLKLKVRYENTMAITYVLPTDPDSIFAIGVPIQVIKPIKEGKVVAVGDMEAILSNFDFTVVRAGMNVDGSVLVDADFEHDEAKHILRLKNIHCPIGSTLRCMKYAKKGYWLPPTQAISLFLDWDKRDPEWKVILLDYLGKANSGEGLTQKQIDELEEMMRID